MCTRVHAQKGTPGRRRRRAHRVAPQRQPGQRWSVRQCARQPLHVAARHPQQLQAGERPQPLGQGGQPVEGRLHAKQEDPICRDHTHMYHPSDRSSGQAVPLDVCSATGLTEISTCLECPAWNAQIYTIGRSEDVSQGIYARTNKEILVRPVTPALQLHGRLCRHAGRQAGR